MLKTVLTQTFPHKKGRLQSLHVVNTSGKKASSASLQVLLQRSLDEPIKTCVLQRPFTEHPPWGHGNYSQLQNWLGFANTPHETQAVASTSLYCWIFKLAIQT